MRTVNRPDQRVRHHGTTLIELVVAISLITVIFAALLPIFSSARKTWDTAQDNSEALQNGRVLLDHLNLKLSQVASIESVSSADETQGYIEFTDFQEDTFRYDISGSGYVEFGEIGSLVDLAGPVSQLQFTCYDGNDLSTPITDANLIRLITIETTITHSGELTQDKVFSTSVFINQDMAKTHFEGWWCLDDDGGKTALDSSGYGRDGTLENMSGNEWTTGVQGGALEFNGSTDYVDLPIGTVIEAATDCTIAAWVNWSGLGSTYQRVFDFRRSSTYYMYFTPEAAWGGMRFAITDGGQWREERTTTSEPLGTGWHHFAATINDADTTHTLYIDGQVVGQNTSATTNPSDLGETTSNWLGARDASSNKYFDGVLDDVRFYSRALSAKEISDLAKGLVRFVDFEEAKTSSDVQSLTIQTPGNAGGSTDPVASLGGIAGSPFTVPSGSNRLLIYTAHVEDYDDDITLAEVTYGGQAMTLVKEERIKEGSDRAYVVAYMLNESGITSASDNTFSPTWSGTPDSGTYYSFAVENVNQDAPIGDTAGNSHSRSALVSTDVLSTQDGDMAIAAATAGNTGSYSLLNGFTESAELSITSADGVIGTLSADGSDITPSVMHLWSSDRQVVIGFVIRAAPSEDPITTIEGDLLIAVVAADGTETIDEPAGQDWTLLSHGNGDGQVTVGVWAKLASASESPSHTFTWGSNEEAYGWIMQFTGHDANNPIDVMDSSDGSAKNKPPTPSVTTTVGNAMILRIGGFDHKDVNLDITGLSDYTDITMDISSENDGAASGGAGYILQSAADSSGTETFSLSNSEEYRTITIAIAPDTP